MIYNSRNNILAFLCIPIAAAFIISCSAEGRIRHFNDTAAAPESQADKVVATLAIKKGDKVADLGTGGGYFTEKLALAVGPAGTVYAIDINEKYLAILQKSLKEKNITNVTTVLADGNNALKIPERSLDLIFARNVFHEINDQASYFKNIEKFLKPGGKIAIIDYKPVSGGGLFMKFLPEEAILTKMTEAGYVRTQRYDFLLKQWFSLFATGKN